MSSQNITPGRAPGRLARCLGVALVVVCAATVAHAQSAAQILSNADRIRNPEASFRLTNSLTEYRNGVAVNSAVLVVLSKVDPATGQYRNLIRYQEPARDAGKALLMDGRVMWFFDPSSNASIRISPQQRLLGQASNGDALNLNLSRNYSIDSMTDEHLVDVDKVQRECWKLNLVASSPDAIYVRIEYWIEHGTYLPVMSRIYSDSGEPLKVVYYRKPRQALGGVRPSEAIILDLLDPTVVTKMVFDGYKSFAVPESIFQRGALPSLQAYDIVR